MSSEIVRRFRGVSAEPYEGYQQAVLRIYGHLPEFQLYRDLSEAASRIEALEAENERLWEFIGRVDTALRYEDDMAVFKSGNSVGAIRKGVVFLSQAKE